MRHRATATPHAFGCDNFDSKDRHMGDGTTAQALGDAAMAGAEPARAAASRTPVPAAIDERCRIHLSWLVQLHWWAILGQTVVVVAAEAITGIALPTTTLVTLLVVEVVGNFALGAWGSRAQVTDAAIAVVMLLDVFVLTVLLDLTGGVTNPFTTLYLVNVALGAVLLPPRWSWGLMVATLLGYGGLFVHEALVGPSHHVKILVSGQQMVEGHLRGTWVAGALTSIFVVFFVQRVSLALAQRDSELQTARSLAARREKLASLATLAAGAAHELGTPLGTIAIVAKELQLSLATDARPEVTKDLQLVREMVARCREILNRMSAHAGEHAGEPLERISATDWARAALDGLPVQGRVAVEELAQDAAVVGPPRALADALRGLLKNGIQASPPDAQVTLRIVAAGGRVRAAVRDRGAGMSEEVLARVGEPFFTTKGPGDGMGLGLFLTRALAEQLDGEFHITSRSGQGTEAWIELPAAGAAERSAS
jgi:two-component system sensor histidine kinase RegB